MKKTLALMLAIMLIASAWALALSPQLPGLLKRAVGGQTFAATCRGWQSVGDNFAVNLLLYERARYSREDIEAIEGTDYIEADIGAAMVYSVTPTDDGYVLNENDPNADPVYLTDDGEGGFFAQDADGRFFMKEAIELAVPVAGDAEYIDATDPDAEPATHTAQELIDALQEDRGAFENLEVTFNDDGAIAVLRANPAE